MADIFFFIGAIVITISYVFKDILYLRMLAMIGSLCYMLGAVAVGHHIPGMKVLIFFSCLTFLINLYQFFVLAFKRTP